jgi:hypothetical protein
MFLRKFRQELAIRALTMHEDWGRWDWDQAEHWDISENHYKQHQFLDHQHSEVILPEMPHYPQSIHSHCWNKNKHASQNKEVMVDCVNSKSFAHYQNNRKRFDVSSKGLSYVLVSKYTVQWQWKQWYVTVILPKQNSLMTKFSNSFQWLTCCAWWFTMSNEHYTWFMLFYSLKLIEI